jgi:hypothetical protein
MAKKSDSMKSGYTCVGKDESTPIFLGKPNQIQKDRSIANSVAGAKSSVALPAPGKHGPFSPTAVPKMKSVVKKTKKGMR